MASIKPLGDGWRVQLTVKGQRDSKTFAKKRDAEEWAAARAKELRALATGGGGGVRTLLDALREYAEIESPKKRGWAKELIRLKAYEGQRHWPLPLKRKLGEITAVDMAKWRDARLARVARGSVLRDIATLSAVFEAARRDWGWITHNPVSEMRKPANPDHRQVVITPAQVAAMVEQLGYVEGQPIRTVSQAVAVTFLVALNSGMRAGELCSLTWDRVSEDHVQLPMTKNGTWRDVPLTHEAARLIEVMRGWDDLLVFGVKSQSLDALFRKARVRAGMEGFTFHDSRHTAATNLARQLHILDLCKMFGWKKLDQALVYYNPSASDIAALLRTTSEPPNPAPQRAAISRPTRA